MLLILTSKVEEIEQGLNNFTYAFGLYFVGVNSTITNDIASVCLMVLLDRARPLLN